MKLVRTCLLLGAAFLVAGSIGGCLKLASNEPQSIFTASPAEYEIPFTASFDGTLSQRGDEELVSYVWTFGDGGGATGAVVDHTYVSNGTFEVMLTVIDKSGASDSSSITVKAINPAPTAAFSYSPKSDMEGEYIVAASEWITFDASASTDDGEVVSYEWDFGDGDTATGAVVEHRWLYAGTYNVVLTVTDDDGDPSTYVDQIAVLGSAPCYPDTIEGGTCQ